MQEKMGPREGIGMKSVCSGQPSNILVILTIMRCLVASTSRPEGRSYNSRRYKAQKWSFDHECKEMQTCFICMPTLKADRAKKSPAESAGL